MDTVCKLHFLLSSVCFFLVVISMEIFLLMAVHRKFRTTVSYNPVAKYARYDLLRIPTLPHGPFAMFSPGESETTKLVLTW